MMTDFIHALSHFHKIWAVCDKSPKGDKASPVTCPRIDFLHYQKLILLNNKVVKLQNALEVR